MKCFPNPPFLQFMLLHIDFSLVRWFDIKRRNKVDVFFFTSHISLVVFHNSSSPSQNLKITFWVFVVTVTYSFDSQGVQGSEKKFLF